MPHKSTLCHGADQVGAAQAAGAAVPAEDRRGSDRAATVFTIGKLATGSANRPCMVRDISAGGMRIQMTTPPPVGSHVMIEMRGLDPRTATVRWVHGRDAGLAFDTACDLTEIFDARVRRSGKIARQPRFPIEHRVEMVVDGTPFKAKVSDISVGGARLELESDTKLAPPCLVVLKLGLTFDVIAAEVCWTDGRACGLRFLKPISSIALALALEATGA